MHASMNDQKNHVNWSSEQLGATSIPELTLVLEKEKHRSTTFEDPSMLRNIMFAFEQRMGLPASSVLRSETKGYIQGCKNVVKDSGLDAEEEQCSYRVAASQWKSSPYLSISRSCLEHTCDMKTARQRNPSYESQSAIAGGLNGLSGASGMTGATVADLAGQRGVSLLPDQAKTIAKLFWDGDLVAAIGDFRLLEVYIKRQKESDPHGSYLVIVTTARDGTRQIGSVFHMTSAAKQFLANDHRHVAAADATYLTGVLHGTLFTIVTKDANEELVLLAWGRYQSETKEAWYHFIHSFRQIQCPGGKEQLVILCDAAKGLETLKPSVRYNLVTKAVSHVSYVVGLQNVEFSRCSEHLQKNCKTFASQNGESVDKGPFWGMVKSTTGEDYERARVKLAETAPLAAKWMDDRKEEYATHHFINRKIRRFGDTTSNMAEQFNSVIAQPGMDGISIKQMSIIKQMRALINRSTRDISVNRLKGQELLEKNRSQEMTDGAIRRMHAIMLKSNKFVRLDGLQISETTISGSVSTGKGIGVMEVRLLQPKDRAGPAMIECKCRKPWDIGMPCKHVAALIRLAQTSKDPRIRGFWISTYIHQYEKEWNPSPFSPLLGPNDQVDLMPFQIPKPHRKAEGIVSELTAGGNVGSYEGSGVKPPKLKQCKFCNMYGHNRKKCPEPQIRIVVQNVTALKQLKEYPSQKYEELQLVEDAQDNLIDAEREQKRQCIQIVIPVALRGKVMVEVLYK